MKYNLDDEVYTIDEYTIKIEKHTITSIFMERKKTIGGKDSVVLYGFDNLQSSVNEENVFTKEEAQLELLQRVKQRHAGDINKVKKESESL